MRYLGIDVHQKDFMVCEIDRNKEIILVKEMDLHALIDYVSNDSELILAIDAPYGLNHGLMDDLCYRKKLNPNLKGHHNKKVSEYELTRRGLQLYSTPSSIDEVSGWKTWMQNGFKLYGSLENQGLIRINSQNILLVRKGIVEVFPHACFAVILGHIPPSKKSPEGVTARLNVLKNQGILNINSILSGSTAHKSHLLDAMIAAYTAFLTHSNKVTFVGDVIEGEMVLPTLELKNKYRKISKEQIKADYEYKNKSTIERSEKTYSYKYKNVDSIIWYKYFEPIGETPEIRTITCGQINEHTGIYARIQSTEDTEYVEVLLVPIKNSQHGLKVHPDFKDRLRAFWGSHGDRKEYLIEIGIS